MQGHRWLPEGFTRLEDQPWGGARYRLGPGPSAADKGLSIVLLPGIEGDARVFARQVELARRWPVLALDLPATGADLPDLARPLEAALPTGPCVIFGASLGGLLGRALAERWPGRVRGLVTLGSLPHPSLLPDRVRGGARLLEALPEPAFRRLYRRRIQARYREEGIDHPVVPELLGALPTGPELRARLGAIRAWGLSGELRVPTLSLRGQVDREAPWSGAQVAQLLPGSGFETIPGGHRAMLSHPQHLHTLLAHFIDSLS